MVIHMLFDFAIELVNSSRFISSLIQEAIQYELDINEYIYLSIYDELTDLYCELEEVCLYHKFLCERY